MQRVSILIPVRNCEAWVGSAIRSALGQTWPNREVIVADDGSSDESLAVIRGFGSALRCESGRYGGQNRARNRLLELARGEWLTFLDADDELAPDAIEQKMPLADRADVIYGSMEVAEFSGDKKIGSQFRPAVVPEDLWVSALKWQLPNTSATSFRRDAIKGAGGWPVEVANCTDYALYFRLLFANARFEAAPSARSLYRQWSPAQAVHLDPLRMVRTKLDLLWRVGAELQQRGLMSAARREAWADEMLQCIRSLCRLERSAIGPHLERLRSLNPRYLPSGRSFSLPYRVAYRAFGVPVAERLSQSTHRWRQRIGLAGRRGLLT